MKHVTTVNDKKNFFTKSTQSIGMPTVDNILGETYHSILLITGRLSYPLSRSQHFCPQLVFLQNKKNENALHHM